MLSLPRHSLAGAPNFGAAGWGSARRDCQSSFGYNGFKSQAIPAVVSPSLSQTEPDQSSITKHVNQATLTVTARQTDSRCSKTESELKFVA